MKKAKFATGDRVYLTESGKKKLGYIGDSLFVVCRVGNFNGCIFYDIYQEKDITKVHGDVGEEFLLSPEGAWLTAPIPNLCKLSDALDCLDEKEKNATVSCDTDKDNRKLTVNILGTDYAVVEKPLEDCDGYCDSTTKEIAVTTKKDSHDMGDFENYRKKTFRHEVIHAYHFESGLAENFENKQYGFSETLVDWFSYQSPKIFKTFEELGIL